MILEACVSTISGLKAAQKYGVQRIEICKDLHLEGLTPTEEFQSIANDVFNGESYVMIRPHNNGFEYTKNELELMMQSIKLAKNNQAHGVVFGILQNDKVDLKKNEELVKLAKDLDLKKPLFFFTFHGLGIMEIFPTNFSETAGEEQLIKNRIKRLIVILRLPVKIVFAVNKFRFLSILIGIIKT
ncbi:copper homeostasis protein CutC [Flavobacteriales bacterium]|nr:copper homeostasis protein CutC [Flavobacteriales bacterium]